MKKIDVPKICTAFIMNAFLMCNTVDKFCVYNILQCSVPIWCNWNGRELMLVEYSQKINVFFVVDDKNELYYLIPGRRLECRKIYAGEGTISKIGVNSQAKVVLFYNERAIVEELAFEWDSRDTALASKHIRENVRDIYVN